MSSTDNTGNEILEVIADANHFNKWMYQTIKPFLHGTILEIGSGIGNISSFLIEDNLNVSLSDTDDFYIETLKKKFSNSNNLNGVFAIDLSLHDFKSAYEIFKGQYDTIFLLNVLEHIQDDKKAVEHCKYLLKPNGKLIILTPAFSFLYSKLDKALGHYRRYNVKGLKNIFTLNQLEIQKGFYFNALGIFAWLYAKLFRLKTIPSGEMKLFNKFVPISKFLDKFFLNKIGLSVIIVGTKKIDSK